MKYLLVLSLFLICSCKENNFYDRMHEQAKEKGVVCYLIVFPKELAGYYCLKYVPKVPMKDEQTFKDNDPFNPKEDK